MTLAKNSFLRILFSVIFVFLFTINTVAQTDTIYLSLKDSLIIPDLFESDSPLECTMEFDIKKFQQEKNNEKYHKASLYISLNDTITVKKNVRIKARGIFRKQYCTLPPYWLNLQRVKSNDKNNEINEKYKVVTHCNQSSNSEEYILKEYLAYKTYNLLTDYSFRVRLVKFTYIDRGRKNKTYTRWGFIIEPADHLARRLNGAQLKLNSISMYHTDPQLTDLVCINAFMMGNTDWSIAGRHNIKLIKQLDESRPALIPIPYDFDYTGFVNTSYARPAEGTGITHVQQRVYVGPCREIIDYKIAAQTINLKKEEILSLIENFEHLSDRAKSDLTYYLEEYFYTMQRSGFFKYHIDIDCREQNIDND